MKVLGLDTATSGCSVALWVDGAVVARQSLALARGQSEVLLPMVMAVLEEAGATVADIDRFAVTVGPGAFTGLRIGLATARGLALATGRPLVGITTFEAVAHGLDDVELVGRQVLVAVESKREDVFVQLFDADLEAVGEPQALPPAAVPAVLVPIAAPAVLVPAAVPAVLVPAAVPAVLVAGDAADRLREALAGCPGVTFAAGPGLPDAGVVARLAATRAPGAAPPAPLYLRPPDAKLPQTPKPQTPKR